MAVVKGQLEKIDQLEPGLSAKENTMNKSQGTTRKHSNITCNCSACREFDHAETAMLPRLEPPADCDTIEAVEVIMTTIDKRTLQRFTYYRPVRIAAVEVMHTIDTETGQQYTYYWPMHKRQESDRHPVQQQQRQMASYGGYWEYASF
jgi:hypothetical protein